MFVQTFGSIYVQVCVFGVYVSHVVWLLAYEEGFNLRIVYILCPFRFLWLPFFIVYTGVGGVGGGGWWGGWGVGGVGGGYKLTERFNHKLANK